MNKSQARWLWCFNERGSLSLVGAKRLWENGSNVETPTRATIKNLWLLGYIEHEPVGFYKITDAGRQALKDFYAVGN